MRSLSLSRRSLAALGLVGALAAGCEIISGLNGITPNESAAAVTTGTASSGPGGTATQSSSSSSSSSAASSGSSMGGGGMGGMTPMCTPQNVVQKCGADTACKKFSCPMGMCATTNEAKGTMCPDATHLCDGNGNCFAAGCADGAQDGDETDIDCGGSCAPCPNGDGCKMAKDCQGGFCNTMMKSANGEPGTCEPCAQDKDCGGGNFCDLSQNPHACAAQLANGTTCTAKGQCMSGNCALEPNNKMVCCDNACDHTMHGCEACLNKYTGKPNGTCAAFMVGIDYWSACGLFNCVAGQSDCPNNCMGMDSLCQQGAYCAMNGSCTPTQANGSMCSGGDQCVTTYCVDMTCCATASCPVGMHCNINGKGTCM